MESTGHRSNQKLLLTGVCRPFGGAGEGDSVGAELFHAQVTRAQGPFSLRQVIRVWAIDYIAHNLVTPTVTLHYPSEREFVAELRQGGYTHVGINFVVATFHKVRRMVKLIRRHAPRAKIVLGGYGTVLPNDVLGPWSDAICRQEGIGFMRELLGEPLDRPVTPPHAPIPSVSVLGYQLNSVVGHVTAGLGCSNACDFCCTSHFFKRKYVPYLRTGREVYEALIATRERAQADGQTMNGFIVIDEDFFINHKRAREFLECVREGGEPLSLMGFGSVRGLSLFSEREIAEMGFDLVWNAFEGADAGYRKQQGKPMAQLYRELKSVGCAQLTSMIIGFPYQDEPGIWREFEANEHECVAIECEVAQDCCDRRRRDASCDYLADDCTAGYDYACTQFDQHCRCDPTRFSCESNLCVEECSDAAPETKLVRCTAGAIIDTRVSRENSAVTVKVSVRSPGDTAMPP